MFWKIWLAVGWLLEMYALWAIWLAVRENRKEQDVVKIDMHIPGERHFYEWLSGGSEEGEMLEAAVLAVVPFFPASTPDGVVIVLVSFVSSLQFNGFQRTHGMACSTVVCTANLRSACKHLYHALTKKDFETALSSAKYLFIIGFFILGACISFWAIELWGKSSIWLCSIMLVIVHFILVITERSK